MIEEMPDEYINMEFIVANRAEVKNMFLTEYNEQKVLEKARMEGVKEGIEKGIEKGADLERERVAADLIKEGGMSAPFYCQNQQALRGDCMETGRIIGNDGLIKTNSLWFADLSQ